MEKRNRFLKFHAAQAILTILGLPWVVAAPFIVLGVILAVALGSFGPHGLTQGPNSGLATLALFLPSCGIYLGYFGAVILWVWGMVAAFTGKYVKLPIVGGLADRWASRLPMPTP